MKKASFLLASCLKGHYSINCGSASNAEFLFSVTVNLIINSVPLFLFNSSSPSNWSTRVVISCIPRLSRSFWPLISNPEIFTHSCSGKGEKITRYIFSSFNFNFLRTIQGNYPLHNSSNMRRQFFSYFHSPFIQ